MAGHALRRLLQLSPSCATSPAAAGSYFRHQLPGYSAPLAITEEELAADWAAYLISPWQHTVRMFPTPASPNPAPTSPSKSS